MAQLINSFVMSPKVNWIDIYIHLDITGGFCLCQCIVNLVAWHTCDEELKIVIFVIDVTVLGLYVRREVELWNYLRYLSDIKILLGIVLHHKVHCNTQFFHSVSQDSQQHHIIAFATSLPHSLLKSETIPEIIKVSDTHFGFWCPKHQTLAFVQGSGTATLSPLNYISFEESSRPNHKDQWLRLQRCNCIIVKWWLTRCLTVFF